MGGALRNRDLHIAQSNALSNHILKSLGLKGHQHSVGATSKLSYMNICML